MELHCTYLFFLETTNISESFAIYILVNSNTIRVFVKSAVKRDGIRAEQNLLQVDICNQLYKKRARSSIKTYLENKCRNL